MTPQQMKDRTKKFGLRVIRATQSVPRNRLAGVLAGQLMRSGTSVGANYRAACRARSKAEFLAKLGIVEEEADESLYWMELLVEAGLVREERISSLMQEANEIVSITVASINTTRKTTARVAKKKSAIRNPKSKIKKGKLCE